MALPEEHGIGACYGKEFLWEERRGNDEATRLILTGECNRPVITRKGACYLCSKYSSGKINMTMP